MKKPIGKLKVAKMTDPVRYPKVINGFEGAAKKMYEVTLKKIHIEISKLLTK